MKYISFNINGIRATLKTDNLHKLINDYNPDFICFQEVKATLHEVNPTSIELFNTYPHIYWNSSTSKKGYAGTAIFTKNKPLNVSYNINNDLHDKEGRVITLEYKDYYFVTVYTPNSKSDLSRLDYRVEWDKDFLEYIMTLENKKPVIICGDLNVAHTKLDIKNYSQNKGKSGCTKEEIQGFDNLLNSGFTDILRYQNPNKKDLFTWWSPIRKTSREKNIGWRVDYFVISNKLLKAKEANIKTEILKDYLGSDHCPILLEI